MNNSKHSSAPGRWLAVVIFATAMAWVESAVVFYLRTLIERIQPHQVNPLPGFHGLEFAELVREAATLVMLFSVGWLAGRDWRHRLGYAFLAFGVWDIFYYVFLKVLTGWPNSISDWDILFLLPLPWWGPVWAPVCIALLMIGWGTLVTQWEPRERPQFHGWKVLAFNFAGVAIALYVFMADALRVAPQGTAALRTMLPTEFNWPLFGAAVLLMSMPVLDLIRQIGRWRAVPRVAAEEL